MKKRSSQPSHHQHLHPKFAQRKPTQNSDAANRVTFGFDDLEASGDESQRVTFGFEDFGESGDESQRVTFGFESDSSNDESDSGTTTEKPPSMGGIQGKVKSESTTEDGLDRYSFELVIDEEESAEDTKSGTQHMRSSPPNTTHNAKFGLNTSRLFQNAFSKDEGPLMYNPMFRDSFCEDREAPPSRSLMVDPHTILMQIAKMLIRGKSEQVSVNTMFKFSLELCQETDSIRDTTLKSLIALHKKWLIVLRSYYDQTYGAKDTKEEKEKHNADEKSAEYEALGLAVLGVPLESEDGPTQMPALKMTPSAQKALLNFLTTAEELLKAEMRLSPIGSENQFCLVLKTVIKDISELGNRIIKSKGKSSTQGNSAEDALCMDLCMAFRRMKVIRDWNSEILPWPDLARIIESGSESELDDFHILFKTWGAFQDTLEKSQIQVPSPDLTTEGVVASKTQTESLLKKFMPLKLSDLTTKRAIDLEPYLSQLSSQRISRLLKSLAQINRLLTSFSVKYSKVPEIQEYLGNQMRRQAKLNLILSCELGRREREETA